MKKYVGNREALAGGERQEALTRVRTGLGHKIEQSA